MEREARSLALEEAYVHEVYHQMGCQESRAPWPRVVHFLNHLEPGSVVCDVGCGSGKYLSVNPSVFKLGVDRCYRLAETAKIEQNEVLVCDNLSLPFRDESFDAVLSIAVVHHFATTERRVGALRELARVLRIGGRLVISVWAMEQRHRKFEWQDVLVPWHRPQALSTPSLELTPTTTSEESCNHHPYTACTQISDTDSTRSLKNSKDRKKGKEKQKEVTTSPTCSSLSSPNESCYSFVRRALQKLAGNRRNAAKSRPWFLDSWTSCSSKDPPPRRYDPEGCEDIHDLPIELRRLEDDHDLPSRRKNFSCGMISGEQPFNQKSRSLSDIFNHEQKHIVRSQSSVPSLDNGDADKATPIKDSEIVASSKPRLVKQKKSVCDDDIDSEERDQATDMKDLVKALPEFKISGYGVNKKANVFKQSSMNEELMSTERLREKEKLKKNIQKQASLNDELIFNRNNRKIDSFKDSIFSTSTAKRFQILKNGLTNKIKSSTTGIEKVAGSSIKNGFVRILQGWTNSDVNIQIPQQVAIPSQSTIPEMKNPPAEGRKEQTHERRHSKEDGSDSSKDSSLQSDTSVDSEDSFASVIFIPKTEQVDEQSTNTSPTLHSNPASPQPTSPKIKFPPPISPKLKTSQHSMGMSSHPASPKLKNPTQLLVSSSPSSPKIKYFSQSNSSRSYQNSFSTSPTRTTFKPSLSANGNSISPTSKCSDMFPKLSSSNSVKSPTGVTSPISDNITPNQEIPPENETQPEPLQSTSSQPSNKTTCLKSNPLSSLSKITSGAIKPSASPEKQPNQPTKENQKSVARAEFPLVKRSMTVSGRDSPPSRPVPRLLSLEIFNPETDDMDSDSSGLSSPDSIGSVISIKTEEETNVTKASNHEQKKDTDGIRRTCGVGAELSSLLLKCDSQSDHLDSENNKDCKTSSKFSPLLEAAAGVATCLEETVGTVIQSSPRSRRKQLQLMCDPWMALQDDVNSLPSPKNETLLVEPESKGKGSPRITNLAPSPKRSKQSLKSISKIEAEALQEYNNSWDEECRQHLADFAEKLSEKLLAEIDRYREQKSLSHHLSPVTHGGILSQATESDSEFYLSRLNEDLEDINKITVSLQKDDDNYHSKLFESVEKALSLEEVSGRIKGEGASSEEKHVESNKYENTRLKAIIESDKMDCVKLTPLKEVESDKKPETTDDNIPLLQEDNECFYNSAIEFTLHETDSAKSDILLWESNFSFEPDIIRSTEQLKLTKAQSETPEKVDECLIESGTEISSSEGIVVTESRKNIVIRTALNSQTTTGEPNPDNEPEDELLKLDNAVNKEAFRKPSISIEMTDLSETEGKEKEETEYRQLSIGLSMESNDGPDNWEKTGSSSDGSRCGSRRETMQISDSGSVLSLRPGLSVESSEAGELSEKGGSDGSRDSRRNTMSLSDVTSCSQNSLLRPGTSVESSDPGDVSEKTGSDSSRPNTGSAGKTPSTASFTSDRASDCSKDARFADRRMARCDGRSSSEETPLPKSCTNRLVRQGASAKESCQTLSKTQSCESSLSGSTSHDSLISDTAGGAITFHRYYHVFKEGELDQLIENYVENLHIISSYYDHSNWCIIAEKVQVWTI